MASGGVECLTKPMDEKQRNLLRSRRVELARDMEPRQLIHHMADVLSPEDEEEIKAIPTRWAQSEKLLDILPRRGQKAFDSFVKALKEVQPFLVDFLVDAEMKPRTDEENSTRHRSVPEEIIVRGRSARVAFHKALLEGTMQLKKVPIMIVGQGGSGKTSLKKSLKGKPFDPEEKSTVMMEIDPSYFTVSTEDWKILGRNQAADSVGSGGRTDEDALIKMLQEELGKDEDDEEAIYATLWDFGGQFVYYTTSTLFITENAMYFLVYNLSRNPDDKAIPLSKQELFRVVQDTFGDKTNMAYLDFWMSMISCFASQDEGGQDTHESQKLPETLPPVFFVCTHADDPYNGGNPKQLAREIYGNLHEKKSCSHLVDFFVVDNTKSGTEDECPDIPRLKTAALEVAKGLPHLKQNFPKKWFKYEKALKVMQEQGYDWIPIHLARKVAVEQCSITDEHEFETLMTLLHDKRILVHFTDTPELNEMIILNLQWMIDVFKKVITIAPFESKERNFHELWLKLQATGILEKKLLEHVWSPICLQEETSDIIFGSLTAIMERFSLLCPLRSSDATSVDEYLVPSMLKSPPPEDIMKLIASLKTPSLFLKFESGQVPPNLFPRLVVQFFQWCTEKWPSQPHPQLFLNFARFYIHPEDGYSVILLCHSSSIEVAVYGADMGFDANSTRDMHSRLTLMLQVISEELFWLKNMQFEVSVLCPVCGQTGGDGCKSHQMTGCRQEECLHFLSESELRNFPKPVICTRSFCLDNRVQVKMFSHWFGFLDDEHATTDLAGGSWSRGREIEEKVITIPTEVLNSLRSRRAKEIVAQLPEILHLDLGSLEEPEPATKRLIRDLATKAKQMNRPDVMKHLREIVPAGTTGPLLNDSLDVQHIPLSKRRQLTIGLSGGDEWKLVAERLGLTIAEIRFLDRRTLNPFEAALGYFANQQCMTVGDLYDLLVECGLPAMADLL